MIQQYYFISIAIAVVLAYLLGSVSSAVIVCKMMHLPDPRSEGSKNPGATNVLRIGSKKAAIITLGGDTLKGLIPVLLAHLCGFDEVGVSLVALAVFLGHLYPLFFKFQGGKGVATAIGALFGLAWPIALALIILWLIVAATFRYSSLAAIVAAIAAPCLAWYFMKTPIAVVITVISILLVYRHHINIQKLINGTESKIRLFKQ